MGFICDRCQSSMHPIEQDESKFKLKCCSCGAEEVWEKKVRYGEVRVVRRDLEAIQADYERNGIEITLYEAECIWKRYFLANQADRMFDNLPPHWAWALTGKRKSFRPGSLGDGEGIYEETIEIYRGMKMSKIL